MDDTLPMVEVDRARALMASRMAPVRAWAPGSNEGGAEREGGEEGGWCAGVLAPAFASGVMCPCVWAPPCNGNAPVVLKGTWGSAHTDAAKACRASSLQACMGDAGGDAQGAAGLAGGTGAARTRANCESRASGGWYWTRPHASKYAAAVSTMCAPSSLLAGPVELLGGGEWELADDACWVGVPCVEEASKSSSAPRAAPRLLLPLPPPLLRASSCQARCSPCTSACPMSDMVRAPFVAAASPPMSAAWMAPTGEGDPNPDPGAAAPPKPPCPSPPQPPSRT